MKSVRICQIFILCLLWIWGAVAAEFDFSKIEGWTETDSVQIYDTSNLWEYINGAADQFIGYDFQNLYTCVIEKGEIELAVEIYDMHSVLNAFGIYMTERGEPENVYNIGAEAARVSPHLYLMLKDKYYIKINIYEGKHVQNQVKTLMQSISSLLEGSEDLPKELNLLPQTGKISGSERFIRNGYQGISDLKNCIYADYADNYQYFILIPEKNMNNEQAWQKLSEKWKRYETNDLSVLYKKIPYKGLTGISKTKAGIFGVTDAENTQQILERFAVLKDQVFLK